MYNKQNKPAICQNSVSNVVVPRCATSGTVKRLQPLRHTDTNIPPSTLAFIKHRHRVHGSRVHNSRQARVFRNFYFAPKRIFSKVKSTVFKVQIFKARNEGPRRSVFVASLPLTALPRKHFVAAKRRVFSQVSRTCPKINCRAGRWLFLTSERRRKDDLSLHMLTTSVFRTH